MRIQTLCSFPTRFALSGQAVLLRDLCEQLPFYNKRKVTLLVLALASFSASAQDQEIRLYRSFGGMRFEMDTLTLTHRQVAQILSINPQASEEFQIARRNNAISGVLGFSGALLLAVPVFSALLGGEPEWALAAGGAGMVIASIPFSRSYHRKAESAVNTYNAGIRKSRIYFTGTGFTIKF